jgi:predicted alpha/beta-hydrolase family hydrolase
MAETCDNLEPGEPPLHGYLHSANNDSATKAGSDFLVLTHGAGGNCNTPLLIALAENFAAGGINTLRCDLPFRQRRPKGPPSPADAKHDQAGLRRALTLMRQKFTGRAFVGGASYGGRQASMMVAADPALVEGLLLLSYPLHPPGKPLQPRTAHFPDLQTPALFLSGTRDPFGSIAELQTAIKLIPAPTQLVPIESAGHGLLQSSNRAQLPSTIVASFLAFFVQR